MIVITTPTGQIGSKVVQQLLHRGEKLRVVARDPSHVPQGVREAVELFEGSHGDAAVIDPALDGADALFWLVPPNPQAQSMEEAYLAFTWPAVQALQRHGVGHVVAVKALAHGTRWEETAGLATASNWMTQLLATSGAALRSLAMPSFMDNVLMQIRPLCEKGVFFGPVDADRAMPRVATRDIASVAAGLLVNRSWSGPQDVPVLGPEDLSFHDMAAILSDVIGKRIRYEQISFDAFADQLRGNGMSEDLVQGYGDMMRAKNEGLDSSGSPADRSATPTTFRQWCEEELKPAMTGLQM